MQQQRDDTTIRVSKETKNVLTKLGTKGQSFEEILRNIICFWMKSHDPAVDGVCILACGGCIDPCDDCPNMDKVKYNPDGSCIQETLCTEEQGSDACYKIACPSCKYYWKKNLHS